MLTHNNLHSEGVELLLLGMTKLLRLKHLDVAVNCARSLRPEAMSRFVKVMPCLVQVVVSNVARIQEMKQCPFTSLVVRQVAEFPFRD